MALVHVFGMGELDGLGWAMRVLPKPKVLAPNKLIEPTHEVQIWANPRICEWT